MGRLAVCLCLVLTGCRYAPRPRRPGPTRVTWVAMPDGTAFKMVGPTTITIAGAGGTRHGVIFVAGSEDFGALNTECDRVMDWYRPFAEQDGDTWVGIEAVVHGAIGPDAVNDAYRLPYEKDAKGEWHVAGTRPAGRPTMAVKLDGPPPPDFTRDPKDEQEAAAVALAAKPHHHVHSIRSFGEPRDRPGGPFVDVDLLADGDAHPRIETVHLSKRTGTWLQL